MRNDCAFSGNSTDFIFVLLRLLIRYRDNWGVEFKVTSNLGNVMTKEQKSLFCLTSSRQASCMVWATSDVRAVSSQSFVIIQGSMEIAILLLLRRVVPLFRPIQSISPSHSAIQLAARLLSRSPPPPFVLRERVRTFGVLPYTMSTFFPTHFIYPQKLSMFRILALFQCLVVVFVRKFGVFLDYPPPPIPCGRPM